MADAVIDVRGDERLVALAAEGDVAARDEILSRYWAAARRFSSRCATNIGLFSDDVEEAQNESVLWIINAIQTYDQRQQTLERGCSFRTFLYRVLHARLIDFARSVGRRERWFDRTWQTKAWVNEDATSLSPRIIDHAEDPIECAQAHESSRCLNQAILLLTPCERQLWSMLCQGIAMKVVAEQLGVTYDTVKHRRHRLIKKLRAGVGASQA